MDLSQNMILGIVQFLGDLPLAMYPNQGRSEKQCLIL